MSHLEKFCLAGVMGDPVLHSRSPRLHNYWFQRYGLSGSYVPLTVKPAGLPAALAGLPVLGFAGCNVTIPHKEAAMAAMDSIDPVARRIGAINCVVVRVDGSLHGANNDGFGYIASIRERYPDWRADAGPVVVLGAGGGARAVVTALCDAGAREVRLINRTRARAERLASDCGGPIDVLSWPERGDAVADAAMVVNATSQGMSGQPPLDLPLGRLPSGALASDIIYIPKETAFLAAARARGNPTVNGLGMLLNQARPAFEAWFGILPEITPELRRSIEDSIP